jgi:hypothetical protein
MLAYTTDPDISKRLREVSACVRRGETTTARRMLREVLATDPANAQAWTMLGYIARTTPQRRAALRRALDLTPDNKRLQTALRELSSPQHVRAAAEHGIYMGYARADELFTVDLAEALDAQGIETWLDMADATGDWHDSIGRALQRCGLMLLIVSPEALESTELRTEMRWFRDHGKLIVPVIHRACNLRELAIMHPPIDFRTDFQIGMQTLLRLLQTD